MTIILGLVMLSAFLTIEGMIVASAISTIGVITSCFIGFVGYQDIKKTSNIPYAQSVGVYHE